MTEFGPERSNMDAESASLRGVCSQFDAIPLSSTPSVESYNIPSSVVAPSDLSSSASSDGSPSCTTSCATLQTTSSDTSLSTISSFKGSRLNHSFIYSRSLESTSGQIHHRMRTQDPGPRSKLTVGFPGSGLDDHQHERRDSVFFSGLSPLYEPIDPNSTLPGPYAKSTSSTFTKGMQGSLLMARFLDEAHAPFSMYSRRTPNDTIRIMKFLEWVDDIFASTRAYKTASLGCTTPTNPNPVELYSICEVTQADATEGTANGYYHQVAEELDASIDRSTRSEAETCDTGVSFNTSVSRGGKDKRRIIDQVTTWITGWLESRIRLIALRSHANGESSGSQQRTTQLTPVTSTRGQQSGSYPRRNFDQKGKGKKIDEEDEEDADPDQVHCRSPINANDRKFACPFFKHNPQNYREFGCSRAGWREIHRLKEHLYRTHMLPIRCERCSQVFETSEKLTEHIRAISPCEVIPPSSEEGINQEQLRLLKSRKRGRNAETESEHDKWVRIYKILFKDDLPVPSPYVEYNANTQTWDSLLQDIKGQVYREAVRLIGLRFESSLHEAAPNVITAQSMAALMREILEQALNNLALRRLGSEQPARNHDDAHRLTITQVDAEASEGAAEALNEVNMDSTDPNHAYGYHSPGNGREGVSAWPATMREASGVPIWSQEGQPDPGIGPSRTQEIFESPAFNPTGYYALTEMELQELFAHTAEISSADFEQFAGMFGQTVGILTDPDSAYHSLETNTEAIDDRSKGKGKEVDADFNA